MGYQVFITRGNEDSDDGLISEDEWFRYVADDPQLTIGEADEDFLPVVFDNGDLSAKLIWQNGAIWSWSPIEDTVAKMVKIAGALNARAYHENGTLYVAALGFYLDIPAGRVDEYLALEASEAAKAEELEKKMKSPSR